MVTRELVLWSDTMDGSIAMILAGRLVQIKTVTQYLIRPKNSGFGTGNLVQSYAKRLAAASLFALVRMKGLGHVPRPPDFTIESTAFIENSVSELPLAVLTSTPGWRFKSQNSTKVKTQA